MFDGSATVRGGEHLIGQALGLAQMTLDDGLGTTNGHGEASPMSASSAGAARAPKSEGRHGRHRFGIGGTVAEPTTQCQ